MPRRDWRMNIYSYVHRGRRSNPAIHDEERKPGVIFHLPAKILSHFLCTAPLQYVPKITRIFFTYIFHQTFVGKNCPENFRAETVSNNNWVPVFEQNNYLHSCSSLFSSCLYVDTAKLCRIDRNIPS